ncbi:MAG: response regulator [Archangiaceae bacterium]|nr:response regulator [Archangiaceae bacterium]
MRTGARRLRVMLVGDSELFEELLVDLLRDLGIELERAEGSPPELVFAVVREGDFFHVLAAARRVCGGSPVVAVLPLRDERLVERAYLAGATRVCALDGPLDALRLACSAAVVSGAGAQVEGAR